VPESNAVIQFVTSWLTVDTDRPVSHNCFVYNRPVVQYAAQQGSSTGIHDQVQGAARQRRHVLVRSSELGIIIKQVAGGKLCEARSMMPCEDARRVQLLPHSARGQMASANAAVLHAQQHRSRILMLSAAVADQKPVW